MNTFSRRQFCKASLLLASSSILPKVRAQSTAVLNSQAVPFAMASKPQAYLGENLWGNRLQDWRVNGDRLECLNGQKTWENRTVALLSHQLSNKAASARLTVKLGTLEKNKKGYGGFLVGVGAGELETKSSAIVQRCAGDKGGLLAVVDSEGKLSFRDFSDSKNPLAPTILKRGKQAGRSTLLSKGLELSLEIMPSKVQAGQQLYRLTLSLVHSKTQKEIDFAVLDKVPTTLVTGGLSLVSSPLKGQSGNRWWFSDLAIGGDKLVATPKALLGPVMGCMYSLNQSVLKLTCQMMPVTTQDFGALQLQVRKNKAASWKTLAESKIKDGYVGLFRINNWDAKTQWQYRVVASSNPEVSLFSGIIVKDHGNSKELKVALYSCIIPTSKSLDGVEYTKLHPQERLLERYSNDNILFPHSQLVGNCDKHDPDLYLFVGDQYYESYPTRFGRHTKEAKLDTLYRWYLWYWTFANSIANRPSIMLADDHDVLQGNLWGNEGIDSNTEKEEDGGFKWDKDLVRMVYRCQHGHNPDPYDPTPIRHNIPVAYGNFVYGGVDFALVEDRKFKTPPDYDGDPKSKTGQLLGARQEAFLKAWKDMNPGLPKVCITASIWGSPQTDHNSAPLLDYDSNGYPADGRTRAVKLVADAKALVLAGDQHLGMVAHQGINSFDDGATFFAGPAAAAFWQRWFEGQGKLPNQYKGDPNTGNFTDTFGNKMRVMAVANPKMPHKTFQQGNTTWGKFLADRNLKTEGYGLVRINHKSQNFILECWEHDANPQTDKQMQGWPVTVPFGE